MSDFYSESTDEGTKTSSENNKLDGETKENSVDKASGYRDFIEQQQARSTTEKTKSDLKIWGKFCHQRNEFRKIEAIPWVELNLLLCAFFKDVRKKNGDEYEPGTLTCLQRSIQRYLNTHGSQANLIQGDEFKLSREVLSAKRKQLVVERGKGNRPQASREVAAVEEDKLFRLFAYENMASTTRLLYSAQFGGSWLYILALEQEMKVEGFSGATSALKLTRTQAMKCWSGKLREARRRARGRTKQAVTEHFILLLKLLITSDVQSSTISCSEVTGSSR